MVRVEVEEGLALRADKVMRARRTATGDADALRHFERLLQRGVVYGRHAVDAKTCAEEYERGLEDAVVAACRAQECVLVDVRVIGPDVDAQIIGLVGFGEDLNAARSGGRAEPFTGMFTAGCGAVGDEAVDGKGGGGVVGEEGEEVSFSLLLLSCPPVSAEL